MITDLYQEYLYVIGKLKDIYGLHIDVDHKDIHTFYHDKQPLFKLMYGIFEKDKEPTIVVSFHIDLTHPQAILWFTNIYRIHPLLVLRDSYIEDSNGETFLGEDAYAIREVYQSQEILGQWLDNHTEEEIKEYTEATVSGRAHEPSKTFDSRVEKDQAIIEFNSTRKPGEDDTIH
jgi:hypothetical protein